MVFRKPYAFLIKHFKLLHLILSGLMIYLSIRINLITNLFDRLASNTSVSLVGLTGKYINVFMYLVIFCILAVTFIIWFLMKNKEKPTKYYVFAMFYYIVIFIFLIVYSAAMGTLEETAMTNQALRAYRDISLLVPLGQYYFIVIAILRGIGFNIKQFNFSKDIRDLEINEEDSEEIEVSLSSNVYKYERIGRKYFRELKYYFFENKYWILLIVGFFLIVGLIYIFVNYKFVNNNFNQGSNVNASYYNFSVNNTYIATKDLYGEIVRKEKKYVIIDLSIKNKYYKPVLFETRNFRLFIGNDYYYAINNKNSAFKDLGLSYDNRYLDSNEKYNYILIYEIDKNVSTRNMKLKVYDSIDNETSRVKYVNINLKPFLLNEKQETKFIKLNEKVLVDENNEITINKYDLVNNYEYGYELCVSDKCSEKTGVIVPNDILNNKLILIDYELNIDESSNLYGFVKNDKTFFNTFASLTYTLNGKKKIILFNTIVNDNIKNKVFMEVSKEIENASSIELLINTRMNKYIYKLK